MPCNVLWTLWSVVAEMPLDGFPSFLCLKCRIPLGLFGRLWSHPEGSRADPSPGVPVLWGRGSQDSHLGLRAKAEDEPGRSSLAVLSPLGLWLLAPSLCDYLS